MPRFLDLDLDDYHQRSLFQAWMCSEPTPPSPGVGNAPLHYDANLTFVCSAGSQTTPPLLQDTGNMILGVEATYHFAYVCSAMVNAGATYTVTAGDRRVSEGEPESPFIENERILAFRPVLLESPRVLHQANVTLSPDAIRFVDKARGRRLRVEEDPELQSE